MLLLQCSLTNWWFYDPHDWLFWVNEAWWIPHPWLVTRRSTAGIQDVLQGTDKWFWHSIIKKPQVKIPNNTRTKIKIESDKVSDSSGGHKCSVQKWKYPPVWQLDADQTRFCSRARVGFLKFIEVLRQVYTQTQKDNGTCKKETLKADCSISCLDWLKG